MQDAPPWRRIALLLASARGRCAPCEARQDFAARLEPFSRLGYSRHFLKQIFLALSCASVRPRVYSTVCHRQPSEPSFSSTICYAEPSPWRVRTATFHPRVKKAAALAAPRAVRKSTSLASLNHLRARCLVHWHPWLSLGIADQSPHGRHPPYLPRCRSHPPRREDSPRIRPFQHSKRPTRPWIPVLEPAHRLFRGSCRAACSKPEAFPGWTDARVGLSDLSSRGAHRAYRRQGYLAPPLGTT